MVQEEASLAAGEHWKKADVLFREGQTVEAARELTHPIALDSRALAILALGCSTAASEE